jgi:hypothetical protein
LLALSTTSLLTLLSLIGKTDVGLPAFLALGFTAVAGCVLLVMRSRVAAEPVIPPLLFKSRVFVVATLTIALNFLALQGVGLFLPLFFQLVLGMSPSRAGLMTVPLMGGLIFSSIIGGKIVSAIGRYKILPLTGLVLVAIADFALSQQVCVDGVRLSSILPLIVLLGLGAGLVMPILTMAIQNAVEPANLGAATATSIFFRSLGATFGVTLAGAVMNWRVGTAVPKMTTGPGAASSSAGAVGDLLSGQDHAMIAAYQHGLSSVYFMGGCFVILAFLCVRLLPENPLRSVPAVGRPAS